MESQPPAESPLQPRPVRTRARGKQLTLWPQKVRSWTSRTSRAVQADSPPTWGMDLRRVIDRVDDAHARSVIDVTMRVAEAVLTTGAPAVEVVAIVLRLTSAYGLSSVHVDVTYTSIVVSHHRGADADPVTAVRFVRQRTEDYDRLGRLLGLIDKVGEHAMPVADLRARFDEIMALPHRYRASVIAVATGVLAAGVSTLLGATWPVILLAFAASAAVSSAQKSMARRRLPPFFAQMVGGAIPTAVALLVAGLGTRLGPWTEEASPSLVVAAGIVALLAGLSVVGAAQDAIDGFYVTAGARSFQVVVLTAGLVTGILLTLGIAGRLGTRVSFVPSAGAASSPMAQVLAASVIASAYAVCSYASPRTVAVAVAIGAIGWSAFLLAGTAGLGTVVASAAAGVVVGLVSQVVGKVLTLPTQAVATAGIVALLPGMMVFRGLHGLVVAGDDIQRSLSGAFTLAEAGAIGLALAGGVSLGTYVARPLRRGWDRYHEGALIRVKATRGDTP